MRAARRRLAGGGAVRRGLGGCIGVTGVNNGVTPALVRRQPIHYFVLIGAQLAVGAAALMARAGLDAGMTPLALSAWRLTVASVVLISVPALAGRWRRARPCAPSAPAERVALDPRTVA